MECDRNVDTWDCMRQRVIQGISSIETYALWIIMCFIARMMYLYYLGQPVFNGHYGLAISWIQCPRGNIFLNQFQ